MAGTVIMAVLFVWVFFQDRTKNNSLHEQNNTMLKSLIDSNKNLADSNKNIAKSLEIITNNLLVIDRKIDRNFKAEMNNKQ